MMVKYVPVEAPAIVSAHLYLDQHYKFNSVLHKFRGGINTHYIVSSIQSFYGVLYSVLHNIYIINYNNN